MDSRRDFMAKLALLPTAAMWEGLLPSINKAVAIAPEPGSTFLDAEHVVILMQENRSFDHCFGSLRGVRGFNDPRAIVLPNENPVWVQTNDAGASYAPFRLNIHETNATWLGSLPHSWTDQVDARNGGRCDRWLQAKVSGHQEHSHIPLTLGYYNRDDLPFYYALADAFTICDQNFCSSLTGTTPNRLYLWTGTIRAKQDPASWANVLNSDVTYKSEVNWTTFPERLEEHGISWKVYQNELSVDTGLRDEAEAWLANFTDNPLEWFTQYGVRYAEGHRDYLQQFSKALAEEVATLESRLNKEEFSDEQRNSLSKKNLQLAATNEEMKRWSAANFQKLPLRNQKIHARAFSTNREDPDYHKLAELNYHDGERLRRILIPKGDVLQAFRRDVDKGNLPTISWLVAPERFSDHPGSAWYGAWYLSQVLEILTQRPEVWKKTVFILTYDENDGYFDHVPPFVPPHPTEPETGKVSADIDPALEFVEMKQELTRKPREEARESPIGLGYRVPMIIASPWSRGGCVCSEIFDHTSVLQFLEALLRHKTGKNIQETNISQWRRTICGDLTSAFRSAQLQDHLTLPFHQRDELFQSIHRSQFLAPPAEYAELTAAEVTSLRRTPNSVDVLPQQEPGTRPSAPLFYELAVDGSQDRDRDTFTITFEARNQRFGNKSLGAPFVVYARHENSDVQIRNYAVAAGDRLEDAWSLERSENGQYDVSVHGPNGFFRHFQGDANDPLLDFVFREVVPSAGNSIRIFIELQLLNHSKRALAITLVDNSYGRPITNNTVNPDEHRMLVIDTAASNQWYDFSILAEGYPQFEKRYAGRIETGNWGNSDPAMGRVVPKAQAQ